MTYSPHATSCVLGPVRGEYSKLNVLTTVLESIKNWYKAQKHNAQESSLEKSHLSLVLHSYTTMLLEKIPRFPDDVRKTILPDKAEAILDAVEIALDVGCYETEFRCDLWKGSYRRCYPKCHAFCHLAMAQQSTVRHAFPPISVSEDLLSQLQDLVSMPDIYVLEPVDPSPHSAPYNKRKQGPQWEVCDWVCQAFNAMSQCRSTIADCAVRERLEARLMLATCLSESGMSGQSVNMLFAIDAENPLWDEVCIHVGASSSPSAANMQQPPRTRKVTFENVRLSSTPSGAHPGPSKWRKNVPHFCELLEHPEDSAHGVYRFNVTLGTDNAIFRHKATPRSMCRADLGTSVSLASVLSSNTSGLNDTSKQILAVILSYALFYLYGSPWLGPYCGSAWAADNIMFFIKDDRVLLRPFFRSFFDGGTSEARGKDIDEADNSYDASLYPDPVLVNFAILLLEIQMGKSIESYLGIRGPVTKQNDRWAAAYKVYQERKIYILGKNYNSVIETCLNHSFTSDEDDDFDEDEDHINNGDEPVTMQEDWETGTKKMRSLIFSEIVSPLHDELENNVGDFLGNIDKQAETMDLVSGLSISTNKIATKNPSLRQDAGAAYIREPLQLKSRGGTVKKSVSFAPITPAPLDQPLSISLEHSAEGEVHSLFSDAFDLSPQKDALADNWFKLFKDLEVVRSLEMHAPGDRRRVRIAILDTGVDMTHPDMQAADTNRQIIKVCDWVGGRGGVEDRDMGDVCGHGTHIASIILNMIPNVDLYIARVTESSRMSNSQAENIAQAIDTATSSWKCHIINLSLGFTQPIPSIDNALHKALNNDVLVFAAASNDGGNSGVAYPALCSRVMCIYSTDGEGNDSHYNPTPSRLSGPRDRFGIVGENVQGAWPLHASSPLGDASRRMSGTSFATPVAAAVAACIMGVVSEWELIAGHLKLASHEGMSRVFRAMAVRRKELAYLNPIQFLGRSKSDIQVDIHRALNPTKNEL